MVSAIGKSTEEFYDSLKQGKTNLTFFQLKKKSIPMAAIGPDFDSGSHKGSLPHRYVCAAMDEALAQAGISAEMLASKKVALVGGTMNASCGAILEDFDRFRENTLTAEEKKTLSGYRYNSITDSVALEYELKDERITITNSCATGVSIIEHAKNLILNGSHNICLIFGVDLVNESSLLPMNGLKVLEKETIRPFDKNRKGTLLGDGAGVLVLESLEHARERESDIIAEVRGISIKKDVLNSYFMSSEKCVELTMEEAIRKSNLTTEDIDYINAHGTGTPSNDRIETNCIKQVFQERAYKIPISSTKSFIGHTGAAAGIIEVIAGIMAIKKGIVPPTINYSEPDPECDLNYVPNQAIAKEVDHFMSNSLGFGGVNASIVISKILQEQP